MKTILGILCATFAIQLVVVLGDAETHVPGRFKAGLEFHQDAGDKAATRSITSANQDKWASSPVQTPINEENTNLNVEDNADEALEDLDNLGDVPLEDADQLATRGLDDEQDEFAADEEETDAELATRSLLESGMNMLPTAETVRQTASNLRQTAAKIPEAVANAYHNPQAVRDSLRSALSNAKERVLGSEVRNQMTDLYKSGLNKGIEAYKALNKQLSPGMAKTLNHGVSSTIRGVQAAKESQIAKSISEKIGSWLP